jgi:hypothetical protein
VTCPVCEAPAIGERCPFCRVELRAGRPPEAQEILDFLAAAIPGASSRRGTFDRGPIRAVELPGGLAARSRRGDLVLSPAKPLDEWVQLLLADLRRRARSDLELRAAVTRRGWSLH